MTQVDQFESVFRAAIRDVFVYEHRPLASVLLVTDLSDTTALQTDLELFLPVKPSKMNVLGANDYQTTADLLNKVTSLNPDLICTYRNLGTNGWQFPHSLGEHLDVLLQKTKQPVLLFPHPQEKTKLGQDCQRVMVMTDHLSNDSTLVNAAATFTAKGGKLYLTHIEDETIFERYMDAIAKIATIDTEMARQTIANRLLEDPKNYVESCKDGLKKAGLDLELISTVRFGHHLQDCQSLIESEQIDLLVMNTKDEDQLAMHGLAYPLAIELRQIPMLML